MVPGHPTGRGDVAANRTPSAVPSLANFPSLITRDAGNATTTLCPALFAFDRERRRHAARSAAARVATRGRCPRGGARGRHPPGRRARPRRNFSRAIVQAGIPHLEFDAAIERPGPARRRSARIGEFDRVAEQVEQDLFRVGSRLR